VELNSPGIEDFSEIAARETKQLYLANASASRAPAWLQIAAGTSIMCRNA